MEAHLGEAARLSPATWAQGLGLPQLHTHCVSSHPQAGAQLATALLLFPTLPLATCHPPQDFISSAFSQPPPPLTSARVMLLIIPPS